MNDCLGTRLFEKGSAKITGYAQHAVCVLCLVSAMAMSVMAQDSAPPVVERKPFVAANGKAYALIVCGHPGDAEHRSRFAASISKIRDGLTKHYGLHDDRITLLFGEGPSEDGVTASPAQNTDGDAANEDATALPEWLSTTPAATRDNLEEQATALAEKIRPEDSLWVITLGHTHHERGRSWFNLPGPDLQQTQFARLFKDIKAERQAFFLTMPASGFYVKPLSKRGRIVVTATEPDLEINGTLFPHSLADILNRDPASLTDTDEDGTISMFDLHIAVVHDVANQYADEGLLATEHAQLDDNGDRRASEVQRHFLPENLGGLPASRQRKKLRRTQDGAVSSRIVIATSTAATEPSGE